MPPGVANISVEPYDVWFHGFGTEAGWDVYNHAATGDEYFTHDMTLFWRHVDFRRHVELLERDGLGEHGHAG